MPRGAIMSGPLSTLRVVEFAGLGPAPLAGQLLADLGAEVTVIDRASGEEDVTDVNRRGKKSVALNLKSATGLRVAKDLIARSDILIEGFRPGVMERLGLGPDDCPERLIYGRMTGWGQDGPLARTAGHDINYLAMTGALYAMGPADRPPAPPLNLVADFGGGTMFLIFGILAAVIERGVSGKGQVVDAAMIDGASAMMGLIHGFLARGQWQKERGTNWLDGSSHFYRCYACADGKYVAVGALEPHFFAQLLEGLGLSPQLAEGHDDRLSWPKKARAMEEVFITRSRDAWVEHFEGSDACVAPVLDFEEAFIHPANANRDVFFRQSGVWQANIAPRFGRSAAERPAAPRAPGADTESTLRALGYSQEEIDAIGNSGALT
jgi:alpha-methylacyl-CoA racemase